MKKPYFINIICTGIFLLTSTLANAELLDRGNGMVYDSEQNLTWMQNANVMGKISVQKATEWVENLEYGGHDDWRLPTTLQYDDPSCLEDTRHIDFAIFNERHHFCTNGEMENLTSTADPYSNPVFYNVQRSRYWTSTPYRDGIDPCVEGDFCTKDGDNGIRKNFFWQWDFERSIKTTLAGGNSRYVWAVRDGDVDDIAPPPPPPPPVDPEIAIGEITTTFFVPSFDDGSNNLTVKFIYNSTTDLGDHLWTLQEVAINTPEILDNPNTGSYTSPTEIYLPSVNYRSIDTNQNIWVILIQHDDVGGIVRWKLDSYGDN